MAGDATQTGVSDGKTDDGKEIDTNNLVVDENNPPARLRAMDTIKVYRETEDEPPADAQLAAQLTDVPAGKAGKADTPTPSDDAPTVLSNDLDKVMVKVKIDGVEQEVTVAEMQRQYQKGGAADKRLAEATRLLNEARAQALTPQSPPVVVAQSSDKNDSTSTPEDGNAGVKEFLATLYEGDEDKTAAALTKLLGGRTQSPTLPNEQELIAKLTPGIRQQLVVDSALEKFERDFADLVADPYLDQVAANFIQAEVEGGVPFDQALEVGGKKTRDWLASKGVKPPPEPTPATDGNSKLERKASIDQVPALNKAASTTVEPPQTASDVIASMRKARGMD